MKIFLASHDLGDFAEDLRELVGPNRKTLLITNARDFKDPTIREQTVRNKLNVFNKAGLETVELDLREYFTKDLSELDRFVTDYDPGLIYCIGGDVFLLATALNISGMYDIIRRRLASDATVYGGGSAGAMVAAKDIEIYERDDLRIEEAGSYYGVETVANGLGIIDEYIIPHADILKNRHITEFYQQKLSEAGVETVALNEQDAYIINGNHKTIKRAK